jgi:uncharacterized protein (DUF697 family)
MANWLSGKFGKSDIFDKVKEKISDGKNWMEEKAESTEIFEKAQEKATEAKVWISGKAEASDMVKKVHEKASDAKEWISEKLDDSEAYDAMQRALSKQIDEAFESIILSKKKYYSENQNNEPAHGSSNLIIKSCAMTNAAISGGSSLVPGPWGMVAVVPEISMVIKNQISMVYDIGVANGKSAYINKELLAGIVLSAMGTGAGALIIMHGSKILVKRSSLQIFQKIVQILAGKITQQALKSTISKWLPVVGAAFMAWIASQMTYKIGAKANELFQKEIEFSEINVTESDVDISKFKDLVDDAPGT